MSIDLEKGHKHADLAIQYWTEAKDNADAWRNWECSSDGKKWDDCDLQPYFYDNVYYRRKPKVKLVHGFEVPDISFVPKKGEVYYHPVILPSLFVTTFLSSADENDAFRSKIGQCYPHTEEGKKAAIKHSLAMLGFGSMEEYENAMECVK